MWVVMVEIQLGVTHKLLRFHLLLIIPCFDGDNQLLCMSANPQLLHLRLSAYQIMSSA